jgi:SAM-dependent MidA family methyltransferase
VLVERVADEARPVRPHRRSYVEARLTEDGRIAPASPAASPGPDDGADGTDTDSPLVAKIRSEIRAAAGGRITFARFMELALYHPEHGYYATSELRPTRAGDFLTAPEVHPMFGRLVGRQLTEMWQRLDRPERFVLREHGAGRGVLGETILLGLRADGSELLAALRYEPVDIPGRAEAALRRVRGAGFADNLAGDKPEAGQPAPIVGCVLANELLDALPVHRVGRLDGELVEWFVTWRDGAFGEVPGEPSTPALAASLEASGVALREGQRGEVSLAAPAWIGEAAATLGRGYLLVIDYGYLTAELYGERRPTGTLRAFRGHHVTDDPFRAVGRQDLTAHIDLTQAERAAVEGGLDQLGRTTQAEFLIGLGLGDLLQEVQADQGASWDDRLAAKAAAGRFIDPGALGGFAVLAFGRGVDREPSLRGLSFRVPRLT